MPDDVKSLTVPEFVTKDMAEHLHPTRIEPNRLAFPSPFKRWPGKIIVPLYLSAADYHGWWKYAGKGQPDDDERHWAHFEWETRFHIIKAWMIEGLDSDVLKHDPVDLPDNRLIFWILSCTQPSLEEAVNLPNSPGPSKGTRKTSVKQGTARSRKTK